MFSVYHWRYEGLWRIEGIWKRSQAEDPDWVIGQVLSSSRDLAVVGHHERGRQLGEIEEKIHAHEKHAKSVADLWIHLLEGRGGTRQGGGVESASESIVAQARERQPEPFGSGQ